MPPWPGQGPAGARRCWGRLMARRRLLRCCSPARAYSVRAHMSVSITATSSATGVQHGLVRDACICRARIMHACTPMQAVRRSRKSLPQHAPPCIMQGSPRDSGGTLYIIVIIKTKQGICGGKQVACRAGEHRSVTGASSAHRNAASSTSPSNSLSKFDMSKPDVAPEIRGVRQRGPQWGVARLRRSQLQSIHPCALIHSMIPYIARFALYMQANQKTTLPWQQVLSGRCSGTQHVARATRFVPLAPGSLH